MSLGRRGPTGITPGLQLTNGRSRRIFLIACSSGDTSRGDPDVEQPGTTALETRRRPGGEDGKPSLPSAAPARGFATLRPGGPWGRVRTHYEGLPSMAGRGGDEGGESLPGGTRGEEPCVFISARKHGSRDTNRRKLERRMASAFVKNAYRRKADSNTRMRRSALQPLTFSEGSLSACREAKRRGPARGRHKNTGGDARP